MAQDINDTKMSVVVLDNEILVDYVLGTVCLTQASDTTLSTVTLSDFGFTCEEGTASLPFKMDYFTMPQGASNFKVQILSADSLRIPVKLAAFDGVSYNSSPCRRIQGNSAYPSRSSTIGVDSLVSIRLTGARNSNPVIGVEVRPLQYDAETEELIVYRSFKYVLSYELAKPRLNSGTMVEANGEFTRSFLIITREEFREAIRPFVEWKRQSGFVVYEKIFGYGITPFSNAVTQVIKETYNEADNLQYVMIVGDASQIPGVTVEYKDYISDGFSADWRSGKFQSDFDYSCVDGDNIPDLYIGRIPARNASMASNALAKILKYEISPLQNEDFYNRSLHTAIFATPSDNEHERTSESGVFTCETIRNYVEDLGISCLRNYSALDYVMPKYWSSKYGDGAEIPEDLQRPYFNWDGSVPAMIESINYGVLYCLTNAHGDYDRMWCSTAFLENDFTSDHAAELINVNQPLFFNISCLTGKFDKKPNGQNPMSNLSLTQSLLLSSSESGAVAVYAFSDYGIMGMDDVMAYGLFNGIWPEPGFGCTSGGYYLNIDSSRTSPEFNHTLGYGLRKAQDFAISKFGMTISEAKHNTKSFHLFGDPSMMINTECPIDVTDVQITVSQSSDIGDLFGGKDNLGKVDDKILGNISVTAEDCKGIVITIMDSDSLISSYRTNTVLKTGISLPATVTITAPNRVPYIQTFDRIDTMPTLKFKLFEAGENIEGAIGSSDDTDIHWLYKDITVGLFSTQGNPIALSKVNAPNEKFSLSGSKIASGVYVVVLFGNGTIQDSKTVILK